MSNRIVHEIRHGFLVLRVRRIRADDRRGYSVSIRRFYRNGELWSQSTSFSADDLPSLRYLLDEAHTWIISRTNSRPNSVRRTRPASPRQGDGKNPRQEDQDEH